MAKVKRSIHHLMLCSNQICFELQGHQVNMHSLWWMHVKGFWEVLWPALKCFGHFDHLMCVQHWSWKILGQFNVVN